MVQKHNTLPKLSSLTRKTWLFFSLSLVIVCSLTGYIIFEQRTAYKTAAQNRANGYLELVASEIAEDLFSIKQSLKIIELLINLDSASWPKNYPKVEAFLSQLKQLHPALIEVAILDSSANVLHQSGPLPASNPGLSTEVQFHQNQAGNKPVSYSHYGRPQRRRSMVFLCQ